VKILVKVLIAFILAAVIMVSAAGCGTGGNGGTGTTALMPGSTGAGSTAGAAGAAKGAAKTLIAFSNIVIQNDMGVTSVIGEAMNNDSNAHSFTLVVSFYDKDKKLLGSAVGAVNEVNGGESKIFSAMATDVYANVASYKVQVDTMISTNSNKKSPIEFSNIASDAQSGITTVSGEAKNTDTVSHSFSVVVGFYDKNKKLIGSATGAVNDLAAGDTNTFSALTSGDFSNADSYKAQVDAMIQ